VKLRLILTKINFSINVYRIISFNHAVLCDFLYFFGKMARIVLYFCSMSKNASSKTFVSIVVFLLCSIYANSQVIDNKLTPNSKDTVYLNPEDTIFVKVVDTVLRIKNLSPYFTLHVDSTLDYQFEINKNPYDYYWYLKNSPVGLRIIKVLNTQLHFIFIIIFQFARKKERLLRLKIECPVIFIDP
jgi:hypothetical protein